MRRSNKQFIHNENGAVLWIVMVVSFIIFLIITSSLTYLLEHRQILQMRLQQLHALEIVKNGVVFIKNKLLLEEEIDQSQYYEYYSNGYIEIGIVEQNDHELIVKISGYVGSDVVQTYKVGFDTHLGTVTQFVKTVIQKE